MGDGSGSTWQVGCGWACVVIDGQTRARELIHGGVNLGTVNIAELSAYVYAMLWFAANHGKRRIEQNGGRPLEVHIITDSQTIANHGKIVEEGDAADSIANRALWAAMQSLGRRGYNFTWHWVPRMQLELNWAADQIAGKSRLALKAVKLQQKEGKEVVDVSLYDLNVSPIDQR